MDVGHSEGLEACRHVGCISIDQIAGRKVPGLRQVVPVYDSPRRREAHGSSLRKKFYKLHRSQISLHVCSTSDYILSSPSQRLFTSGLRSWLPWTSSWERIGPSVRYDELSGKASIREYQIRWGGWVHLNSNDYLY